MADPFDRVASKRTSKQQTAPQSPSGGGDAFDRVAAARANRPAAPPQGSTPQDRPGFVGRLAQSVGIPSSMDELRTALSPATIGGFPVAPAGSGLGAAVNYGKNLVQQIRDFASNPNIESGLRAVTALTPGGRSQESFGEDIGARNYPGAAGTAMGTALQFAAPELMERGGPTLNRIVRAGGAGAVGGAKSIPVLGPIGRGFARGFGESWRGSAPIETPPVRPPLAQQVQTPAPTASAPVEPVGRPSLVQQVQTPVDTSNFPTAESRAASDRAFQMRNPAGVIPDRMDPVAAQVWDESAFGRKGIGDPGKTAREANPEPVGRGGSVPAVSDPSTIMPRLRTLAQQIQEQESVPPPEEDLSPEWQQNADFLTARRAGYRF